MKVNTIRAFFVPRSFAWWLFRRVCLRELRWRGPNQAIIDGQHKFLVGVDLLFMTPEEYAQHLVNQSRDAVRIEAARLLSDTEESAR